MGYKNMRPKNISQVLMIGFFFAMTIGGLPLSPCFAQSQKRDHLSEQEADLLRNFQEIDKRVEIFARAADRRLLVMTTPNATQKKKDEEIWGPLPTGSKLELLQDYKHILEEAEEKLDDWYNRGGGGKDPSLQKALSKFKEAITRQIPQLRAMAPGLTDKKEQRALSEAIEEAETITKASTDK
jgi:hypothetical protein